MTPTERSDSPRVDVHALVDDGMIRFRRQNDAGTALWVRVRTDGEGEFILDFRELRAACEALGLNRADVWPEES